MDPVLRALCMEVVSGDVDSEFFAVLLFETGVNIDGFEWDVAARLKERSLEISSLVRGLGEAIQ